MSPRVIVKWSISDVPARKIPNLTFVPLGPRRVFITFSLFIFLPVNVLSSTSTSLSPANTPTPSLGPPAITATMRTVSCWIVN